MTEQEVVTAKEQERKFKLVQKEVKRLNMAKLAEYLKVSRPSVDVMTVPPQSYRLFMEHRDAAAANQIRFDGDSMTFKGYTLKEASGG
jgi:hypothetical protein